MYKLGDSTLTDHYTVKKFLSTASKLICLMESATQTQDLLVSVLDGISTSDHDQTPTSQLNYRVGFSDTRKLSVTTAWLDVNTIFAIVDD
jgi:hypothetical protein